MTALIAILLLISTLGVAFLLYRFFGRKAPVTAEAGEVVLEPSALKSAMHFLLGPFPLSLAIHVVILLLLILTVHQQRGRELIMVNLEAGGGGGGGGEEMQTLDMPEVPLPETAPSRM